MSPRLEFALDAAFRAGRSTLAHFQTQIEVESKKDNSPVTVADKGAERMIRELIEKKYPGENILGEEEGGEDTPDRWIIDPIDGTKSFISGVPLYATLLSYERDGEPILGVCYFPALDEMHYAEVGQGAVWNGRPSHVSVRPQVKGALMACGSHVSMTKYGRIKGFSKLSEKTLATRTWGDAYGHMLVASGRVEAMIDPVVNRWDISAVSLIVREAGGKFTDFKGQDALANEAISSNGIVHAEILEAFRG